ncbi:MAG: hypothetical protein OH316_00910 [Candidatus Parvarchaeota archaeon]|nr:hypothetical protein [Candidatus Parvarchaeota archaeon]
MDFIDIVLSYDESLVSRLDKLGFKKVFLMKGGVISNPRDSKSLDMRVYSGANYSTIIRKGSAKAIYGIALNKVALDAGLCKKLKENEMFVIFDFRALIEAKNYFDVYKLYLRDASMCNEHGVDALFVSAAEKPSQIKSPMQLVSFANEFGYNYSNFRRSSKRFISRL